MPLGGCNIVAQTHGQQQLLRKRLSRPTTACARTGVSIRHRTQSLSSPLSPVAVSLSLAPHTCSYRPQQMQMSLSCVIRGKQGPFLLLTSPWSALPAYLSQQQQQISTFFRGEFLINRLVAVLLASKTEPAPPLPAPVPAWLCTAARDTHLQAVFRQQGRGSPLNQMF